MQQLRRRFIIMIAGPIIATTILTSLLVIKQHNITAPCGVTSSGPIFEEMKQSLVRWRSRIQNKDFEVRSLCPSLFCDVAVLHKGQLIYYTSTSLFSVLRETTIYDCKGKAVMIFKTGSLWQTIINSNKIWVYFVFMKPDGKIVGYIDRSSILGEHIKIYDQYQRLIASIDKSFVSIPPTWFLDVRMNSDINIEMLMAVIGKIGFKSYDLCNFYFWFAAISLISIMLITIGVVLTILQRQPFYHITF